MSDAEFAAGTVLGEYTTIQRCGTGAYGQVYLARDGAGRRCAVKVLSPDRRSERELNGLLRFRQVSHPALLRIHRLGALPDGRIFYSMDAADNAGASEDAYEPDTLARRMRVYGTLPPDELKRILLELASGLAELHRAHLIHRDIKPENILFIDGRAVLADAGTVDDAEGASLVGTPEYLPPEVRLGKRAPAAEDDCHALGKVLYSALTGEPPRMFPGTPHTLESPEAIALFRVAERACTPPGLSVYEFRRLLEHPETLRPRHRARRILFVGAAVAVCLAVAAVAVILTPTKRMPETATVDPTPATSEPRSPDGPVVIRRIRPVRLDSAAIVSEIKAKEAGMRTEIARANSPKVTPVDEKRRELEGQGKNAERGRSASGTERTDGSPTLEELLVKYERSAGEQRIVDRWLAEYTVWLGRINRAGLNEDKTRVAELIAEMKNRLPYGITDFCRDEIGIKKLLAAVSRDRSRLDSRRLELLLQYRRDALKKLLASLPADELAKWR